MWPEPSVSLNIPFQTYEGIQTGLIHRVDGPNQQIKVISDKLSKRVWRKHVINAILLSSESLHPDFPNYGKRKISFYGG